MIVAGSLPTFADLIQRIAGLPAPGQLQHRPLSARAREFDASRQAMDPDWWVILHSTSASGVVLIHAEPVAAGQLEVMIEVPLGAVLSVIVDVKSTREFGDLFETAAEFLGAGAPQDDPGGAAGAGN